MANNQPLLRGEEITRSQRAMSPSGAEAPEVNTRLRA